MKQIYVAIIFITLVSFSPSHQRNIEVELFYPMIRLPKWLLVKSAPFFVKSAPFFSCPKVVKSAPFFVKSAPFFSLMFKGFFVVKSP